jgi:hypothetical protein
LSTYFSKLLKHSQSLNQYDRIHSQYLRIDEIFNELVSVINKHLLITIYGSKSFKPLYVHYNKFIKDILETTNNVFNI